MDSSTVAKGLALGGLLLLGGAAIYAVTTRPPLLSASRVPRMSRKEEDWYDRAARLGNKHRVKPTGNLLPGECLGTSGLVVKRGMVVGYWDGAIPASLPWCYART